MAPLWHQKVKDEAREVGKRAFTKAERRRQTIAALGLNAEYEFDRWQAPWNKNSSQLTSELNSTEAELEGDAARRSTKTMVAELQRAGVPATSDAAKKIRSFHEAMVDLSMQGPILKALVLPL